MRLTQYRIYFEFCPTEVTESLKIVAHCGLHRHLLFFEFATRNTVNNVLLAEQFSNPDAAFTICGTARLNFAQITHSFAQVFIGQLISRFIFGPVSVAFGMMDKQRTLFWHGMEVTENSRRSTLRLQKLPVTSSQS